MKRKTGEKAIKLNIHNIKAIIPAAGLGTRFQPLTWAIPKELLPINRKPVIQLAIEEALAAGISDIGIVIRQGKEVIRKYFEVLKTESNSLWDGFKEKLDQSNLYFIFQKKPLGLGNAIFDAGRFIKDSSFVMIIPDQFILSEAPATSQLLDAAKNDFQAVWSSLVSVQEDELHFFTGSRRLELRNRVGNTWEVKGLSDKNGYSYQENLLGFGRTFFPAGVLDFFSERYINTRTGEVDLFPSFKALIKQHKNYAVLLDGRAMDFGTWEGYEHFKYSRIEYVTKT